MTSYGVVVVHSRPRHSAADDDRRIVCTDVSSPYAILLRRY
jgi:hypothetical protein